MKKHLTSTLCFLAAGALLLTIHGCEKSEKPRPAQEANQTVNAIPLNAQEQALLGKWKLKKTETYEVTGVDSNGQYTGSIISNSTCSSICKIEFKNEYWWSPYAPECKGVGSIGACDSTATFIWKAKQQKKLELNSGIMYDIVYVTPDSIALSYFHEKDILKLKEVYYYKKN